MLCLECGEEWRRTSGGLLLEKMSCLAEVCSNWAVDCAIDYFAVVVMQTNNVWAGRR